MERRQQDRQQTQPLEERSSQRSFPLLSNQSQHRTRPPDVEEALSSMLWTPYERTPTDSSSSDEDEKLNSQLRKSKSSNDTKQTCYSIFYHHNYNSNQLQSAVFNHYVPSIYRLKFSDEQLNNNNNSTNRFSYPYYGSIPSLQYYPKSQSCVQPEPPSYESLYQITNNNCNGFPKQVQNTSISDSFNGDYSKLSRTTPVISNLIAQTLNASNVANRCRNSNFNLTNNNININNNNNNNNYNNNNNNSNNINNNNINNNNNNNILCDNQLVHATHSIGNIQNNYEQQEIPVRNDITEELSENIKLETELIAGMVHLDNPSVIQKDKSLPNLELLSLNSSCSLSSSDNPQKTVLAFLKNTDFDLRNDDRNPSSSLNLDFEITSDFPQQFQKTDEFEKLRNKLKNDQESLTPKKLRPLSYSNDNNNEGISLCEQISYNRSTTSCNNSISNEKEGKVSKLNAHQNNITNYENKNKNNNNNNNNNEESYCDSFNLKLVNPVTTIPKQQYSLNLETHAARESNIHSANENYESLLNNSIQHKKHESLQYELPSNQMLHKKNKIEKFNATCIYIDRSVQTDLHSLLMKFSSLREIDSDGTNVVANFRQDFNQKTFVQRNFRDFSDSIKFWINKSQKLFGSDLNSNFNNGSININSELNSNGARTPNNLELNDSYSDTSSWHSSESGNKNNNEIHFVSVNEFSDTDEKFRNSLNFCLEDKKSLEMKLNIPPSSQTSSTTLNNTDENLLAKNEPCQSSNSTGPDIGGGPSCVFVSTNSSDNLVQATVRTQPSAKIAIRTPSVGAIQKQPSLTIQVNQNNLIKSERKEISPKIQSILSTTNSATSLSLNQGVNVINCFSSGVQNKHSSSSSSSNSAVPPINNNFNVNKENCANNINGNNNSSNNNNVKIVQNNATTSSSTKVPISTKTTTTLPINLANTTNSLQNISNNNHNYRNNENNVNQIVSDDDVCITKCELNTNNNKNNNNNNSNKNNYNNNNNNNNSSNNNNGVICEIGTGLPISLNQISRTFTSTECQTDDIPMDQLTLHDEARNNNNNNSINNNNNSNNNNNNNNNSNHANNTNNGGNGGISSYNQTDALISREQRRRERRERRQQARNRALLSPHHPHHLPHPTPIPMPHHFPPQANSPVNQHMRPPMLPDILHSHFPPPYAAITIPNHGGQPPLPPPPPNIGQPPPPPHHIPAQPIISTMPITAAATAVNDGRFTIPLPVIRRSPSERSGKGCCGQWFAGPPLRALIAVVALGGVACALGGVALGATGLAGPPASHLTAALLMIGVGVILVTVSGAAWRMTAPGGPPCLGLGSTVDLGRCGRRPCSSRGGAPHGLLYPEFQHRPPPPSYQASMQEYRLRLLLLDRDRQNGVVRGGSPPPTYRSHAGSLLRTPLTTNSRNPGGTITSSIGGPGSEYSLPPSYRSRNINAVSTATGTLNSIITTNANNNHNNNNNNNNNVSSTSNSRIYNLTSTSRPPTIILGDSIESLNNNNNNNNLESNITPLLPITTSTATTIISSGTTTTTKIITSESMKTDVATINNTLTNNQIDSSKLTHDVEKFNPRVLANKNISNNNNNNNSSNNNNHVNNNYNLNSNLTENGSLNNSNSNRRKELVTIVTISATQHNSNFNSTNNNNKNFNNNNISQMASTSSSEMEILAHL